MSSLDLSKKIIATSNTLFILNYSLYILPFIINIHINPIPYINYILLIISYSTYLINITYNNLKKNNLTYSNRTSSNLTYNNQTYNNQTYNNQTYNNLPNLNDIFNHPNTYCLLVFITFPSTILLFPFYLLSIHNMMSFILSNKKVFENTRIYKICRYLSSFHYSIGRFALMSEIICSGLCLILYFLRIDSFCTLVAYFVMVRNQYVTHGFMRSVFGEMRVYADKICALMPSKVQCWYSRVQSVLNQIN